MRRIVVISMILAFSWFSSSKAYEINRSNYTLEELYNLLKSPPSSFSEIMRYPVAGKVSKDGFYDNLTRNLSESESEKLWYYLRSEGILGANGEIISSVNLEDPNLEIVLDSKNPIIRGILASLKKRLGRRDGANSDTDYDEMAYRDLQSLILSTLRKNHPKYNTRPAYYYFLEKYGDKGKLKLGKVFKGHHEYRFDEGDDAVMVFRDKKKRLKIINRYFLNSNNLEFEEEIAFIFSDVSGEVVVDTLSNDAGYIVFFVRDKAYSERGTYLMQGRNGDNAFSAEISESLFTREERERMNKKIKSGPDIWGKYLNVAPPGEYLPGSGPGQGTRPGTGEIINSYGPKEK